MAETGGENLYRIREGKNNAINSVLPFGNKIVCGFKIFAYTIKSFGSLIKQKISKNFRK